MASQSKSKLDILDNTLIDGMNEFILETLIQSIGFCQIFNIKSSLYCRSVLVDNAPQSHVVYDLSNVDNMLSLSKGISSLPLSAAQSQLAISRERSSFNDSCKLLLEDNPIQSQARCFVFSNNSLFIVRHLLFERLSQSHCLSWFLIKNLLLTANLFDSEIAFQSHSSLIKLLSKLSSKTISDLPDNRLKSITSLNIFMLLESLD